MQIGLMMRTQRCSPTLLLCLLLALSLGCSRSCPPQKPAVVKVRENCLRQAAPTLDPIRDCLTRSQTGNDALDCLAQGVLVRDAWIVAALAVCGVP